MENPFKKVLHNEKLPEVIKKKVMSDIDLIKLTLDFTDLFAIKYPDAVNDILKSNKKK
ncbi:hypothetical protein [Yeosuana marina]|uniref:hypothetical protein n=1 Tax=Yeosuana marina TaxID=1565536 RepID=UPI00141EBA75|nr:hypothetical protein [Yeosuana marina]|tara:strand:- start:206 stop:379 length:174 start_codon:yes stop_codon:yes gene_type:complete